MGNAELKIIHICWTDGGGAGIAACRLHRGLCQMGADSTLLVLNKKNADSTIRVFPTDCDGITAAGGENTQANADRVDRSFRRWQAIQTQYPQAPAQAGLFTDTASEVLLHCVREVRDADIVNLHWVGGVVHVPDLPRALAEKPTVWTLHDQNPFTGGCHYSG
ncbi:group 1 glycosyl transferase, partial [Planctomycetota bacterium]